MEKNKKNLKILSILILALAVYSLIRIVLSVFLIDLNPEDLTDGASATHLLIGQIFVCVVSVILLIPQIFVGIKGIKVSNNPDSSKAHIVWAVILTVLSVIGILSPASELIKGVAVLDNLLAVSDMALDAIIYIEYINYAKKLVKAA
jgi:uncharacterized membrane protein